MSKAISGNENESARLAESILRAAGPKISEAAAQKRDQVVVWTFERGVRPTDRPAIAIVKERLAKEGYSVYIGIDGNDDYLVSDQEFVVVCLPKHL